MSFFNELKRRNVFRVAVGYLVSSWLLLQVAELLLDNTGAPEWVIQAIMVVLVLGFPVVVFFSWAYEVTPEGIKRESEVDRAESITHITGRKFDRAIVAVLVVALGFLAFDKYILDPIRDAELMEESPVVSETAKDSLDPPQETDSNQTIIDKSIAVLPFVNMSDDAGNEYFADGISEELLNLLAKIQELRVAARTSSFSFKGKGLEIPEIAERLNVAYVLEGSVRKSGNQVRITTQLIQADTGYHMWSETYDRTMDNIFAIQDEIAASVVAQLRVTLLGEMPVSARVNPEAYALHISAKQLFNSSEFEGHEQAIVLLKQASKIDPDYADAWATLANMYMFRRYYPRWDNEQTRTLARQATDHALSLDPSNAVAHTMLGLIAMTYDYDLAAAARHYLRALEIDPNNTDALLNAVRLLRFLGQTNEAIAICEYVISVDPFNALAHLQLAIILPPEMTWDEQISLGRTALRLNPGLAEAHMFIGYWLILNNEPEAGRLEIQQSLTDLNRDAGMLSYYSATGKEAEFNAALPQFIEEYGSRRPIVVADLYLQSGQVDPAFDWLDKAARSSDPYFVGWIGGFGKLHDDPRWLPFAESVGMSPAQLDAIGFNVTLPE